MVNLTWAVKNIRLQLRTKYTRGMSPRPLRAEEIDALETRLQTLRTEQRRRAEATLLGRVDICTSSAAGRVIEYVAQTSHQSEKFFENIGGVDSVASIRLQSTILSARASLVEDETRREEKTNQKLETQKRRAQ